MQPTIINLKKDNLKPIHNRLSEMLIEFDRICNKHQIQYWIFFGSVLGAIRHKGFIPWDDDIDVAVLKKDYKRVLQAIETELSENFELQHHRNEPNFHMLYARIVDKKSKMYYDGNLGEIRKKFKYQGLFLDIFYLEKGNKKLKKIIEKINYLAFRMTRHPLRKSKIIKLLANIVYPFGKVCVFLLRKFVSPFLSDDKIICGYGIPFYYEFRKSEFYPSTPIEFEGRLFSGPSNPDAYLKRIYGNYMELPPELKRKPHGAWVELS